MIEMTVRDPGGDEASRGRGLAVPINEEHLSEKLGTGTMSEVQMSKVQQRLRAQPRLLTLIDPVRAYFLLSQGYGTSCILAIIDEFGEWVAVIAASGISELLQFWQ